MDFPELGTEVGHKEKNGSPCISEDNLGLLLVPQTSFIVDTPSSNPAKAFHWSDQ